MRRCANGSLVFLCLVSLLIKTGRTTETTENPNAFRVNLKRIDNQKSSVFSGFYFDEKDVAEAIRKYPVKLPQPMPADAK